MADRLENILVLLGSASCVLDDYENFTRQFGNVDLLAVGVDAVCLVSEPIKYFATYHPYDITLAIDARKKMIGKVDFKIVSHVQYENLVDYVIPFGRNEKSGSSALLGAKVGLLLNYNKIVLCGCPLLGKNEKGQSYTMFQQGWRQKKEIIPFVRSMSGWTKEYLGEPTKEWLKK